MAEPGLTLTYNDLMREVAQYLGWGYLADVSEGLTAAEAVQADICVQDGYRDFLYSAIDHEWSFLKPWASIDVWAALAATAGLTATGVHNDGVTTLTASSASFYSSMVGLTITITDIGDFVISGYTSSTVISLAGDATCTDKTFAVAAGDYRLPDNFAGAEGDLVFEDDGSVQLPSILLTSSEVIRKKRNNGTRTGRPTHVAVEWLESDSSAGQRFNLIAHPTPDRHYSLQYKTNAIPNNKLSADNPYPLGGAAHSNTIKAAVLAAAEKRFNDGAKDKQAEAIALLAGSIKRDQRAASPDSLGYNRDNSDGGRTVFRTEGLTTYNGVLYSGA